MRTVLIFAYECAPYHRRESTVGAQRPAQFAKHLPGFGWRAIVVCCNAEARRAAVRPPMLPVIESTLAAAGRTASAIVPTPSAPHDGWIDRLWNGLARSSSPAWPGFNQLRRPLTALKLRGGDYSQSWQPVAREAADLIAERVPIDACIGEHSPDAGLHLARWFSQRYGVPWIADFRDPILQPLSPMLRRLYHPMARAILQSASAIVNVTPYWSALDAQEFGLRTATVPNGFDEDDFPRVPRRTDRVLQIAYAGNLWSEMRPELFFEALALLRSRIGEERFTRGVRFAYRGLASVRISELADRAGVVGVVDSQPYVPRVEALSLLAQSDALLLLAIPSEPGRDRYLARGIYPGKMFEYFGARLPIISVPGDEAQSDELLRKTGTGVVLRDVGEIAGWLEQSLIRREHGEALPFAPNEDARCRFSRRSLAGELASLLDDVTGGVRSGESLARSGVTAVAQS